MGDLLYPSTEGFRINIWGHFGNVLDFRVFPAQMFERVNLLTELFELLVKPPLLLNPSNPVNCCSDALVEIFFQSFCQLQEFFNLDLSYTLHQICSAF